MVKDIDPMVQQKDSMLQEEEKNIHDTEEMMLKNDRNSMEDIINKLGLGTWNYSFFVITSLCYMMEVVNLYGAEFISPPLKFRCAESAENYTLSLANNSSQCFITKWNNISDNLNSSREECKTFHYDTSTYHSTLTEEFDLVCDRDWLRNSFQVSFTLGSLVGCIFSGIFADSYGRQSAVWYGALLMNILTIGLTTVPNLAIILTVRFLMGIFTTTVLTNSYTIGLEGIPINHRSTYGLMVAAPYALMVSILAVIAYLIRRWRLIQIMSSFPLLILLCVANPFVLKESPRWLVERGRIQEATEVIKRAARLNKTSQNIPENIEELLTIIHKKEILSREATSYSEESFVDHVISLVSTKSMLKLTLIAILVEIIIGTVYISIPLGSDGSSSPFVYMGAMGLAELPAYTLTAPIASRMSRRTLIACCLLITMIGLRSLYLQLPTILSLLDS